MQPAPFTLRRGLSTKGQQAKAQCRGALWVAAGPASTSLLQRCTLLGGLQAERRYNRWQCQGPLDRLPNLPCHASKGHLGCGMHRIVRPANWHTPYHQDGSVSRVGQPQRSSELQQTTRAQLLGVAMPIGTLVNCYFKKQENRLCRKSSRGRACSPTTFGHCRDQKPAAN